MVMLVEAGIENRNSLIARDTNVPRHYIFWLRCNHGRELSHQLIEDLWQDDV